MNCIDCENHQVIPDPDPFDWFNDDDVAVICLLKKGSVALDSDFVVDRQPFKPIAISCRPYNIRKESETPKWCPLGLGE